MRDIRHDNINPFIGACIDTGNIMIVTQYGVRGSLQVILKCILLNCANIEFKEFSSNVRFFHKIKLFYRSCRYTDTAASLILFCLSFYIIFYITWYFLHSKE